jgi:hypothetical protein
MSGKRSWLVVLFALPLTLGQSCSESLESPDTSEPPVVVPPVVVPPVTPPPPPPPPPVWQPKIFEPVEVTNKSSKRVLTADEIGYVWLIYCSGILSPPTIDQHGPDPTALRVDTNGPIASYHNIFCRFPIDGQSGEVRTALLNLFCLEDSSEGSDDGTSIGISRILEDWDPKRNFGEPWTLFCEPEWSFSETIDNYWVETSLVGQWYSFDITEPYQKWSSNEWDNYGLMFEARGWFGDFASFASAQYPDESKRPWVLTYHQPALQLKMPLPAGKAWVLTVEAGGESCLGFDKHHTGRNFYSLDFSYSSAKYDSDGKVRTSSEAVVPILAAADGVVSEVGKTSANGNYVVINHEPEGYSTHYLHMQDDLLVVNAGDYVNQGDCLGIMGNTGDFSEGVHLHFGVKWNNDGTKDVSQLTNEVTLEGRPLQDFKVNCEGNNYYTSTNQ